MAADPFWGSVTLLVDGVTLTDQSTAGCSSSSNSASSVSTIPLFGANTIFLTGASAFVAAAKGSSPPWQFLTNDFTLEFHIYGSHMTGGFGPTPVLQAVDGTGAYGWLFEFSSTGIDFRHAGGTALLSHSGNPVDATWHHYAVSRVSGVSYLFVDGVLITSATDTYNYYEGSYSGPLYMGLSTGVDFYIANVRITSGVGRYTATFTPPTAPYPTYGYVSIPPSDTLYGNVVLYVDGAAILDQSSFGHTVNTNPSNTQIVYPGGVPTVLQYFTPTIVSAPQLFSKNVLRFGLDGGYSLGGVVNSSSLDGPGNEYLTVAAAPEFQFGSGDFAVEFAARSSIVLGGLSMGAVAIAVVDSVTGVGWAIHFPNSGAPAGSSTSAVPNLTVNTGSGSSVTAMSSTNVIDGTWHQFAWTRTSGISKFLVDGTQTHSWADTTVYGSSHGTVYIGNAPTNGVTIPTSANPFPTPYSGYLANVRITKGASRTVVSGGSGGTSTYTAPSAPLPTPATVAGVTAALDPYFGNVVFLMDGTTLVDQSWHAAPLTSGGTGGYAINATTPLFGKNTMAFNAASWIETNVQNNISQSYTPCLADFTVEFHANKTADNSGHTDSPISVQVANLGWLISLNSTSGFAISTVASTTLTSVLSHSLNPNDGVWHHYAYSRVSGTGYLFQDGVLLASGADTHNYNGAGRIGVSDNLGSVGFFNGNLANIRVTNGVGRYSAAFTPPTAPYAAQGYSSPTDTNWGNVSLLLDSATHTDLSTHADSITNTGTVAADSSMKLFNIPSLSFNGSSQCLTAAAASQFVFGTGDFTIELHYNTLSTSGIGEVISMVDSSGTGATGTWNLGVGGAGNVFMSGSQTYMAGLRSIVGTQYVAGDGIWHHLAISRASGTSSIYVDGALRNTVTDSTNYSVSNPLTIGTLNASYSFAAAFVGHLANVRVTKGVSRYSGNGILLTGASYPAAGPAVSSTLTGSNTLAAFTQSAAGTVSGTTPIIHLAGSNTVGHITAAATGVFGGGATADRLIGSNSSHTTTVSAGVFGGGLFMRHLTTGTQAVASFVGTGRLVTIGTVHLVGYQVPANFTQIGLMFGHSTNMTGAVQLANFTQSAASVSMNARHLTGGNTPVFTTSQALKDPVHAVGANTFSFTQVSHSLTSMTYVGASSTGMTQVGVLHDPVKATGAQTTGPVTQAMVLSRSCHFTGANTISTPSAAALKVSIHAHGGSTFAQSSAGVGHRRATFAGGNIVANFTEVAAWHSAIHAAFAPTVFLTSSTASATPDAAPEPAFLRYYRKSTTDFWASS